MSEQPSFTTFRLPPPPIWKATLINGLVWNQPGDKPPPNAFHRFMQRLAFGIKWERL